MSARLFPCPVVSCKGVYQPLNLARPRYGHRKSGHIHLLLKLLGELRAGLSFNVFGMSP